MNEQVIEIINNIIEVESIPISVVENEEIDFCLIKLILNNFSSFIIGLIMGVSIGFGLGFMIFNKM